MNTRTEKMPAFILLLLAAGFAAVLISSLWQRFLHPSLVVHRFNASFSEDTAKVGSGENSIGLLMESVAKNPQDRHLLVKLIEALMNNRQWPAAEFFAQRLIGYDAPGKEDPHSLYLMAVINHNQGHHAQAAELFEKLLSKKDDASARFSLGIIYFHFLNKSEDGIAQLKKALSSQGLTPGLAEAIREELAVFQKKGASAASESQAREDASTQDGEMEKTDSGDIIQNQPSTN